jgi:pimeloyl-ACP methyl ester carboxylesterase
MPFAHVNGLDLYYELQGQGAPIVLVHEFAGSIRSWDETIDILREQARVLAYNCRGYPPSSVPDGVEFYSQATSADDLRALLDHLGTTRTAVAGLSMGGSIALQFAITHPDRVSALVVASSGSGSDDKQQFTERFEAVARQLEREGPQAVGDHYLASPTRLTLRRKRPELWRRLRDEFAASSVRGLTNTIRGTITKRPSVYELEASLRALSVPTLIMAGDLDTPVLAPSRFLAATLPTACLKIFEGTGHAINLEEPESFSNAILEFLESVRSQIR